MQKGTVFSQKLESKLKRVGFQPQLSTVAENQRARLREKVKRMIEEHKSSFSESRPLSDRLSDGYKWCIQGDEYGVRVYVQEGGSVNERDPVHGRSLLHHAAGHGHLHIVRYLLRETDANSDGRTVMGSSTAVHIAAEQQRRQVLFQLLLSGANPNLTDDTGSTALHYARRRGIVAVLLKFDANPLIRNHERKLPLDVLIEAGCSDDVVQCLARATEEAWRQRTAAAHATLHAAQRRSSLRQKLLAL